MGVALLLALLTTAPATAQTGGEIGGAVTDTQGFAVPGVTVTLEGEALIAPLTAVTLVDGSYLYPRARARSVRSDVRDPRIPGARGRPKLGLSAERAAPLPYGVGLSANVRHQSGWPYAFIQRVDIPGVGTNQPIFLTDLSANRSENVTLMDLRVEKVLDVGSGGRPTLMADVYNALNSNAVTNFSLRAGDDERVIAALDPIALKLGARFQF